MPVTTARVVALGGGHGLHASLSALRRVVADVTAVVTVADNGGSSGRLRGEFGVLPPGDLRMALAALCGDDEWGRTWERVVQHRFAGEGEMRGHVVGNLLIVSLWELFGDPVEALDWVGRLLGAQGRVLPMAVTPMDIHAEVLGLDPADPDRATTVRGQVEVATTRRRHRLDHARPADPPACPEALAAVSRRRLGRARSGLLVHLRDPAPAGPRRCATRSSRHGRVVVMLNLAAQEGETAGFGPEDHLAVLCEHAPGLRVHTVLADPRSAPRRPRRPRAESAAAHGARSSSPTSPRRRHARDTIRRSWPRRTPSSRSSRGTPRVIDGHARILRMAMTAQVKSELASYPDHQDLLPQGRGGVAAAVRQQPPHRGGQDRRRGRARHGCCGAPAAQGHRRGLRPPVRRGGRPGQRHPQGQPLPRPRRQGRRSAGPPDRPARPARAARSAGCRRPSSPVVAATRSPPGAARSWPTAR